ncbi:transmembrane and coiled-coil domain-containing protein 4 isoform X2 [Salmo salar]|uniref:Transmembrane and coiled-coil domain-containing protein 4 isoform X2 n=1 Tax=Salmo salar TaxID=8030 RepID=A0A1S3ME43_SALSA|nr:transmembrane and coiled-coil domain-containing protein 4 isoform X2 [Salmo salar]|eukprot:XP_014001201.1 PREDICTED: transmembrane and coiled-coil domain-containing protein 4 isoform X2 [Salmo salar]
MEEERTKQHCFNPVLTPDPGGEKPGRDRPDEPIAVAVIGRQLTEPGRFAYAGLCGVSLGQLFPGPENRCFREQYLEGLVQWLGLDESVMPVMGAFLAGLGFEGSDTFLSILQAEPLLSAGATPITQDLVSFSVKDGLYDSRSRVLIRHVSCLLRVSPQQLEEFEATLGERLREGVVESAEESSRRQTKERGRKLRRYLLIGLATVGGGAVIGYKMNKRVGAIEEFEFLPLSSGKHLHLTVAVTGWLCTGKYSSFQAPWCSLGACGEQYCLVWESRFLRDLGSTMAALLDGLVSMVAQEALKYTVLSGIVTALMWPASLLAVASVIDNPWSVCLSRSAEVGKHLAQVLRSRQQGKRPVSLIGFSLGARVIYFCLQELAKDQGCEGVVEDVVLLGAPVDGTAQAWERMVKVVAGKIVNGYCRGDWLLGYVYRGSSAQLSVAGLQPISLNDRRIFNVDLSSVVKGHLDYMRQMDTILVAVGVPTREVPGAGGGPLQPLTMTERILDIAMVQSVQGDVAEEQKLVGASAGADETCMGEGGQLEEKEDMGDGWDIPDISDLLDSLNEIDVVSTENILEGNLQQSSERNATHEDNGAPSHLEFDGWGKDLEEEWGEGVEGTESDTEHTSWSWEDTRWTSEHKHMGPNRRT